MRRTLILMSTVIFATGLALAGSRDHMPVPSDREAANSS